jgi:hypothetical protein
MKLTRGSVLPLAGITLVIGLFAWAWIGTARHHSNPVHMGYAVQQMHGEMHNETMPMSTMPMDDVDMASMHEAMLDDGAPMAQMPMTASHLSHMESMGMGSMGPGAGVDADAGHRGHHGPGR